MRKMLAGSILALMRTLALAGGHSGLGGTGTGITVDNEVMEGKTGFLVKILPAMCGRGIIHLKGSTRLQQRPARNF